MKERGMEERSNLLEKTSNPSEEKKKKKNACVLIKKGKGKGKKRWREHEPVLKRAADHITRARQMGGGRGDGT